MSKQWSSQYPSTSHSRNQIYTTESYKKTAQTYHMPDEYRMAQSSSPPLSSSPPMTPYSTRHASSDAFIRSSPEIGSDAFFQGIRERMNDPSSAWSPRSSPNGYPERVFTPLKHDYFSTHNPLSSEFDDSEYSEDMVHDIPEADSEQTSDSAPGRSSVFFSDTEEEENDWNDEFSFGHSGYRTTFFRTSAERGQWKSHPIPFKSTPLAQARSSMCILSRPPTPVLVDSTRTTSEPATSTATGLGFSVEPDQHDNLRGEDGSLPISLEPFNDPHSYSSSASSTTAPSPDHGTKHPVASDKADVASEATSTISPDPPVTDLLKDQSHSSRTAHPERREPTQEIEDSITQMKAQDDNHNKHVVGRTKRKGNDCEVEHPMPKKRKVAVKVADVLRPTTHSSVQNEKKKVQVEKVEKPGKQISNKRRRKVQVEVSIPFPASSRKRSKPPHRLLSRASSSSSNPTNLDRNDHHTPVSLPSIQDPAAVALNAEICGMLIETMALSRASSLPLTSLYKMVMQTQPSLRSQRSESEWLMVFTQVLQEGHGSGVFGKVESSGMDESNRPLEAQWFYVPEQDQDQERATLIRSMMPRPAKRTETKKYKQYYWRPLDKISKWDPEDEL